MDEKNMNNLIRLQIVKNWFCTNYCSEHNHCDDFQRVYCNAMIELYDLPTVLQESKVGHWIIHENHRECSECKIWLPKDMPRNSYCPNCGRKMVEPNE